MTTEPDWIFEDRDLLAQMNEYILFHCYLPMKISLGYNYHSFDGDAALPLLMQLMGGTSCAFITRSQTFVGCFEGKWVHG